jgi:SAM-dependent methyltransferase
MAQNQHCSSAQSESSRMTRKRGADVWHRFRTAYGQHRLAEGRGADGEAELVALPYLRKGPFAAEWRVRARTYERFVRTVLLPRAKEVAPRALRVLDLGAGNGWLCYRLQRLGHRAIALDLRSDAVDGLGAGAQYGRHLPEMFGRIVASFERLPIASDLFDIGVFNASLHYATDLRQVVAEAVRVTLPGGSIAILDSPFYRDATAGAAMVTEKRRLARDTFGRLADDLLALPFVEYLTVGHLQEASAGLGMVWRRHRVVYPLRYELRPLVAGILRRRPPSRFDLWVATVP